MNREVCKWGDSLVVCGDAFDCLSPLFEEYKSLRFPLIIVDPPYGGITKES
jgi:hypothetical protein